MPTTDLHLALRRLFAELADGAAVRGQAYILNSGDAGLLRSLDNLPAAEAVSQPEWEAIREGLRDESRRWLDVLGTERDLGGAELSGMIASIAHLAYHLGAIRQIARSARGPREGTFA